MPVPDFYAEKSNRPSVDTYAPDGELAIAYSAPLRRKCLLEFELSTLLQDVAVKVAERVCEQIASAAGDVL